jgi:flagellar basal-body rod protein FlgB
MNPIGDRSIGTIQSWLTGLSQRGQAISNNIANIDTPGYKKQEVPFETTLQRAIGQSSTKLTTTDSRHIAFGNASSGQLGLQGAQQLAGSRADQNTVDIDQEMVELSETQMRYQAASSALSTKISILRNVIRG